MNNERILHILDQSTCLTRRQMKDYLRGSMLPEEIYAAEMHIPSCPLCRMALAGFEIHTAAALSAITALNSGFLKAHFDAVSPQIHLNSLAPPATFSGRQKRKAGVVLLRISGVAAALLFGFGILWFMDHRKDRPEAAIIPPAHPSLPAPATRIARQETIKPNNKAQTTTPIVKAAEKKELVAAEVKSAVKQQDPVIAKVQLSPAAPEQKAKILASANVKTETQPEVRVEKAEIAPEKDKSTGPQMQPGVHTKQAVNAEVMGDHLQKADELFGASKYSGALAHYKIEMNSASRSRRAQATVMAARCYQQMGDKQKAIALLEHVIHENGPQKRSAKRLLKEINR